MNVDLHVVDPSGAEFFYQKKMFPGRILFGLRSGSGGSSGISGVRKLESDDILLLG
jgi:hypothetical protein